MKNTFDFKKYERGLVKESSSMIRRCRKRTVDLEAIQFHGNFDEVEKFCGGDAEFRDDKLVVATSEGALIAAPNDFIIKDENGKFIVCTPKVFYMEYDYIDVMGIDLATGPDYTSWGDPIKR
jgi:hypothetical protein